MNRAGDITASLGIGAAALAVFIAAILLCGCAGSGEGGAFTPDDFATINRGVNDAVTTYERIRYPDRPVYPPGAPFPIYPPQP